MRCRAKVRDFRPEQKGGLAVAEHIATLFGLKQWLSAWLSSG
jgi:hypothetical protein